MGDIIRDYNHGNNEYGMTLSSVFICIFLNIIVSGGVGKLCTLAFDSVGRTIIDEVKFTYDKYTTSRECHIHYRTYIHGKGWQRYSYDGDESGTKGESLCIEAMVVSLDFADERFTGSVMYQSYIQDKGWEKSWKRDGETSGSDKSGKRVEAFRIQLEGEISNYYDVYYRAYVQKFGWLGWSLNGENAGTAGYGLRLECINIKLVEKGSIISESNVQRIPFLINTSK